MSGKIKATKSTAASRTGPYKSATQKNPLLEARPRSFHIGGDLQPRRDVSRYVKWPRYVRLQRQKRILLQRLKVPATINQFSQTLDKNSAVSLFKLLNKMRPEEKAAKKARLQAQAEAKASGKAVDKGAPPICVKYGLKHITGLIESNEAKLVVIAADVEPIELVAWLPALCQKMNVPYCIVKGGRARLGHVVRKKGATAVAITETRAADRADFASLLKTVEANYTQNFAESRFKKGGCVMGLKSRHAADKRQRLLEKELANKSKM
jgi:large subunit ribosomal protein L7Ae